VRYRIHEDPIAYYVCHCTDCQSQSGAAFGLSMMLRREALERIGGDVRKVCVTLADGRQKTAIRCSECLVKVWSEPIRFPEIVFLSPGTLDDPRAYTPFGNMWTASAHPWVTLAPGPCFERQPEDPIAMVKIWHEHRRALREGR
jgi:hypothetical protein